MMARERPWLGFGPGGVKREYRAFALEEAIKKRTGHVHNTPLQILVERGVDRARRLALDLGRLLRATRSGSCGGSLPTPWPRAPW